MHGIDSMASNLFIAGEVWLELLANIDKVKGMMTKLLATYHAHSDRWLLCRQH